MNTLNRFALAVVVAGIVSGQDSCDISYDIYIITQTVNSFQDNQKAFSEDGYKLICVAR